MPTTTTDATYTHDGGCSNCGAHRPKIAYTEYAHYDLSPAVAGEEGESSGEPFVALVGLEDSRDEREAIHEEAMCAECETELANIEISDWRKSRAHIALDGLTAIYHNMELGDPASLAYSAADQCAALYELLTTLGYQVA